MSLLSEACLINRQNLYKTYIHCTESHHQSADRMKEEIIAIQDEHNGWSGIRILGELKAKGVKIGKDRFYQIVNRDKLTLNSRTKAWRKRLRLVKPAQNLIINHTFYRVFEVLFSDYTEIETEEGKIQLLLVEDLVSRCITAYRISKTCTAAPVVEALEESMKLKESLCLRYPTFFHTDRGTEFVNRVVLAVANKYGIKTSNTGRYHCFENPFMESLNRTLKHSYGLRIKFRTIAEAEVYIKWAINDYNNRYKHSSIGYRVPYLVLTSYTGKKRGKPEHKTGSGTPPGRGARIYSKSLKVKIKKIRLDK